MIASLSYWGVVLISVPVFWFLPQRLRYVFLSAVSFGYLVTLEPLGCSILVGWNLLFYFVAPLALQRHTKHNIPVSALVIAIVSYLAYFKYLPPLINGLLGDSPAKNLIIPLGVSYYTFKFVHYAIEVGRGNIDRHTIADMFCYIYLFPIYTAGPIERFDHFLKERETKWNVEQIVDGITRISHGVIKKFLVAEVILAPHMTTAQSIVQNLDGISWSRLWYHHILMFCYMYMDFSSYSDIAIGTSRLFGIRIMENFNWPILARNLAEFWQRWHMTLAGWCRGYVYMPMIGMTRNPYIASLCTFFIMGLWHAGDPHWIAWGLYHGVGVSVLVYWLQFKRRRRWDNLGPGRWGWLGVVITILFVSAGGALTSGYKTVSIYDSFRVLMKLYGIHLLG